MLKEIPFTKEIIQKEIDAGSLFLLEKYLDKLPQDWIDCIMFIKSEGLTKELSPFGCMICDEDATKKMLEAIEKEYLKLLVLPEDQKIIWSVLLVKEKNEETKQYEKLFIGGENLRKFCDEKNIFYKTKQDRDGLLISGTNMLWEKQPDDDCRVPIITQL
jgi:hypothetical protein